MFYGMNASEINKKKSKLYMKLYSQKFTNIISWFFWSNKHWEASSDVIAARIQ